MKKTDRRVDIRHRRAHIRGANIPVELLIGLGVAEVKKMYPWLKEDQITDALDFAQDALEKQASLLSKKPGGSQIQIPAI